MKSDIEISRTTKLLPITQIGKQINIEADDLIPYGKFIAKVPYTLINEDKIKKSNLILVTAITPTKAGIGKTTTSVGLALGLSKLGKKTIVALREPSLGPCFGMKGGAAGGGYAQVLPMEDINLHFTGDFHAITSAHNMIAALVDNYQYQNKGTDKQLKEIVWKRVLDVNDRSLRYINTGLGGSANGMPAESGFDITPASEIMAIFCFAESLEDLKTKIENIIVGYTFDNQPFTLKNLGIAGAITVLLKNAINPNLVQTTENTPSFVHGGPFANIAHGCNSVLATKMALSFGDYVVTEAGFGADLGAEKFFNIKCRKANLQPKATVLVLTSQALKLHGGVQETDIKLPNLEGIKKGLKNVEKHLQNLQSFGQSVILAFNQYGFDTEEEMNFIRQWAKENKAFFAVNNAFTQGGKGATELAKTLIEVIENQPSTPLKFSYELADSIEEKLTKITQKIYGSKGIVLTEKAKNSLKKINRLGFQNLPVCIAKTQYSFSDDASKLGVAQDFEIHFEDLIINAGAGFIVAVAGNIMRMPGLPKVPQAQMIDIVDGQIEGLS
ncbi:MAG: formate--tetrahydrofolate ligase [Bacteroidetes bacterium]|nr:MAG: formate--tetrahydrofolate ligase [Bacteroidota bacterium]TAG92808.1 MAG: formate--tetrahydrofolate ligase [Bacteroidota bacterium]